MEVAEEKEPSGDSYGVRNRSDVCGFDWRVWVGVVGTEPGSCCTRQTYYPCVHVVQWGQEKKIDFSSKMHFSLNILSFLWIFEFQKQLCRLFFFFF